MNNINISIDKTESTCHVNVLDKTSNKQISFYLNTASLFNNKNLNTEEVIRTYKSKERETAIIEAITYTNNLSLSVESKDFTLMSEDKNRIAVFNKDKQKNIAQITAIKVVDDNNNKIRAIMHINEENNTIDLNIEEEASKAIVTIEIAPYIAFETDRCAYLRTFNEIEYWHDASNRTMYRVDKYGNKELYAKLSMSYIYGNNYIHQMPVMLNETVFFSNYMKCFFKIEQAGKMPKIIKIKDETNFYSMTHLYEDVYLTTKKQSYDYIYEIIEFTDIETATYEVLDSYTLKVGTFTSEGFYTPYVVYNYDDKIGVNFYSYMYNSYMPTTNQYLFAKIDKTTKNFSFDNVDLMTSIIYQDDEYELKHNYNEQINYVNGRVMEGYFNYPMKPLTVRDDEDILYAYTVSYMFDASHIVKIDLKNATSISSPLMLDGMWSNGSYAGRKSVNTISAFDDWSVFKSEDIKKRHIRQTTEDDYIFPRGVSHGIDYAVLDKESIYLKKEVIQNKKLILTAYPTMVQVKQKDNIISSAITVRDNLNVEIKPYMPQTFYFNEQFILEEEKDYNTITTVCDTHRIEENNNFNLILNESATSFDKVDDKYELSFTQWEEVVESFEGEPVLDITQETINASISEELASIGSKSLFLTNNLGQQGHIQFETLGSNISFDVYPSSYPYGTEMDVYINDIHKTSISDYMEYRWEQKVFDLDPTQKSKIRITYYKLYENQEGVHNGYFIDNIRCNALLKTKEAIAYFKPFDLGMHSNPQVVNIKFNDLDVSDNLTQTIYYSTNAGASWLPFEDILPNKDNILLKAIFTKSSIEEEAYVRFGSITVEVLCHSVEDGEDKKEYELYIDTTRKSVKNSKTIIYTTRQVMLPPELNPFGIKDITPENKVLNPITMESGGNTEHFDSYPYYSLNWGSYEPWTTPYEWDTCNTFDEYGFKEAYDQYGSQLSGQGYLGFKNPENYDWEEYRQSQMATFNVNEGQINISFRAYDAQDANMVFKVINNGNVIYEYQVQTYSQNDPYNFINVDYLQIQTGDLSFYIYADNPHADCGLYIDEITEFKYIHGLTVMSKPIDISKHSKTMELKLTTDWAAPLPGYLFNLFPRVDGSYLPTIYNLHSITPNTITLNLPDNAKSLYFGLKFEDCQNRSYTINSIKLDMSKTSLIAQELLDTERIIRNIDGLTEVETVIDANRQVAMLHNWNAINTTREVTDIKTHISHYFNSKNAMDCNYSTLTWDYDKNKYKVVCNVNEVMEQEESFLNYPFNGLRWAQEYCNYHEFGMAPDVLNDMTQSRYVGRVGDTSSPKGVEQVAAFYARPNSYFEYKSIFSGKNLEDYIAVRVNKVEVTKTYFKDLYSNADEAYIVDYSDGFTLPNETYNDTQDCLIEFVYCTNGSTSEDTEPVFTTQAGLILEYAAVKYEEYNNFSWITITPFDTSMYSNPIHLNLEAIGLENATITKIQYRDKDSSMIWHDFNGTVPPSNPITDIDNAYQVGTYIRLRLDKINPDEQIYIYDIHMSFDTSETGLAINTNILTSRTINTSSNANVFTSRIIQKEMINNATTSRSVAKLLEPPTTTTTNRRICINVETTILTQRDIIKQDIARINLDTLRQIHKSLINSLDATRNISMNDLRSIDTKLVITNTEETTINTERQVWNIIDVDKRIDTNRMLYITAASYVTQLNTNFKLHKGTLLLDSQDFN